MKRNIILHGMLISCALVSTSVYAKGITAEVIKQKYSIDGGIMYSLIDSDSNSIYLSGVFRHVGAHNTGGGAVFNQNGEVLEHTPSFNGRVYSSLSDGNGGFYVGGNFTHIGDVTVHYLAHILPDGHVDQTFHPAIAGSVSKLAKVNDTLYAAAGYSVKKVDLITGSVDHNFNLVTSGPINALAATPHGVYIGGAFRSVNNHPLYALAKANPIDGSLDLHFPLWTSGSVRAIQATDSDAVIASGYYTPAASPTVYTVNKYDELTDQIDPNFNLKGYPIFVMTADHDWIYTTVYSGPSKNSVERFNINTGAKDVGYITPNINSRVEKIVVANDYVYVAGGFTQVNQKPQRFIFRYNKQTLEVDQGFNPEPNQRLFTVSASGDKVFIGGYFTLVAGIYQPYLAKFDLMTGKVDKTFHTTINYPPDAMAIYGDDLYLGGRFTQINGQKAYMMARVSKHTGERLANNFAMSPNNPVYTMKVHDGYLYVGGAFTNISRSNGTKYLARFNLVNNTYDKYFNLGLDQAVWAMALTNDSLYVGGQFTDHLRKYNILDGKRSDTFMPIVNDRVYSLVYDDGTVYANTLAPLGQNALFAYNAETGMSEALNVNAGRATRLLKANGYLYLADRSVHRMHLDTKTLDASFDIPANQHISSLSYCCDRLYIGGYFTVINGVNQPYYAMIKL